MYVTLQHLCEHVLKCVCVFIQCMCGWHRVKKSRAEKYQEWKKKETLHDTIFMSCRKVKTSGCAVIVEDVLIKTFCEGFWKVIAYEVPTAPSVIETHKDWHAFVCLCDFVCPCRCVITRINVGRQTAPSPLALLWQAYLKSSKIHSFFLPYTS